jgi:hypothetical protein
MRKEQASKVPHRVPLVVPVVDYRSLGQCLITGGAICLRQIPHDGFESRCSVGFGYVNIHTVCGEVLVPSNECAPGVLGVERPATESDSEDTDRDDAADSEEEKDTVETSRVNTERERNKQRRNKGNEGPNDRGDDMFSGSFGSNPTCLNNTVLVEVVVAAKASCTKGTNTSVIASRISVPSARGTMLPSR